MKKTTLLALVGIPVVIGALVAIKGMQFQFLAAQGESFQTPPLEVTFADVQQQEWESVLQAVGSLEAEDGITVKAELPGKITQIAFKPGTAAQSGDLLVQQDITSELASLRAAEAAAELARSNLARAQRMMKQNGVSVSDFDTASAQAKQAAAQVDSVKSQLEKKSIRAPFAGKLGVLQVSTGQDLRDGDPIVSLQKLNPILVNFFLPQRELARLQQNLTVRVSSRDFPDLQLTGTITAFNPEVDAATRNVKVQARLDNAGERLLPGMFVDVTIVFPERQQVLAIPVTAILYAPFGNSVFVIEDQPEKKGGGKIVRQQIVKTGATRGDFVVVTEGLKAGDTIVTTGVFKLMNGQSVAPDNRMAPAFSLTPTPDNS